MARAWRSAATRRIDTASSPSASAMATAAATIASLLKVVRRRLSSRAHTGTRLCCSAIAVIVRRSANRTAYGFAIRCTAK